MKMVSRDIPGRGSPNAAVLNLSSAMAETDHVVAPIWNPNNRALHSFRNPTQNCLFGRWTCLSTKTASDIARNHSHFFSLNSQNGSNHCAHRVRPLTGVETMQTTIVAPLRSCNPGLDGCWSETIIYRSYLSHHFTRTKINFETLGFHATHHVAFSRVIKQKHWRIQGGFGIDHDIQ